MPELNYSQTKLWE